MSKNSKGQEYAVSPIVDEEGFVAATAAVANHSDKRQDIFYQAQAILSRRDHSEYEMRTKLQRKGFPEVKIEAVVDKLLKLQLLDDEKFAALVVAEILRYKPVGRRWLVNKLQQKGIAAEVIEAAVYDAIDDAREMELAREAAASWRKSHARYAADRGRLTRFLVSRGFSYEVAVRAVG